MKHSNNNIIQLIDILSLIISRKISVRYMLIDYVSSLIIFYFLKRYTSIWTSSKLFSFKITKIDIQNKQFMLKKKIIISNAIIYNVIPGFFLIRIQVNGKTQWTVYPVQVPMYNKCNILYGYDNLILVNA